MRGVSGADAVGVSGASDVRGAAGRGLRQADRPTAGRRRAAVGRGAPAGAARGQPMPVTCRAVVQSVRIALRAEDRVMVPAQTAFFSFVSTPSLVYAVLVP